MVKFENGTIVEDTERIGSKPVPDGWYYTMREFAEMMDIPESTVRIWKKRGVLDCINWYGRLYIPQNFRLKLKRCVSKERYF